MQQNQFTVLESKSKWFDFHLKELIQYRDLIFLFVKRDFISLYKQTILGPLWAIIQPLLTTVVYTLLFGNIAQLGPEGVPAFIFFFSGTMIWTYFSGALNNTANTFVANGHILSKVYFPRLVMPCSSVISSLISLGIQFVFFMAFLLYYMVSGSIAIPSLLYWIMLPVLVLQLMLLSLSCGILISALTTKYRDLKMLITFGLQLWMYAAPVAYDMYRFEIFAPGGSLHHWYMLNPITPILNAFRYVFLGIGHIEWNYMGYSWLITIVLLFLGILIFNRVERTFMDTV